jgi:hypothetical protein
MKSESFSSSKNCHGVGGETPPIKRRSKIFRNRQAKLLGGNTLQQNIK